MTTSTWRSGDSEMAAWAPRYGIVLRRLRGDDGTACFVRRWRGGGTVQHGDCSYRMCDNNMMVAQWHCDGAMARRLQGGGTAVLAP